jgi:hypothetical protein
MVATRERDERRFSTESNLLLASPPDRDLPAVAIAAAYIYHMRVPAVRTENQTKRYVRAIKTSSTARDAGGALPHTEWDHKMYIYHKHIYIFL